MRTLIFTILLLCSGMANAQAFGVNMGEPVSKYAGVASGDFTYRVKVPQPNSEFEFYTVLATPSTGICSITGYGKDYKNDAYGTQVRSSYNGLQEALNSKYGRNKSFDFIRNGALWDDADEFIWSLHKNERTLTTYWDDEELSNMPANMGSVNLRVTAVSPQAAYVVLTYRFDNIDACLSLIGKKESAGL